MFAITAVFSAAAGELRVVGDDQDNNVVISRDAGGTILVNNGAVVIAGGTPTVANTNHLHIVGAGGNDQLSLDQANGPLPGAAIFGGAGNDVLIGGSGIDFVDGGPGNDIASLGGGDDTFQWNPGDGSDVVEGQGGDDEMAFNGSADSEVFAISASGNRVRFTRDFGNVSMDLNDVEAISLHALGGADTITVNDQTATDLLEVNLDLQGPAGAGDGQTDAVILNGTNADEGFQIASFDSGSRVAAAGLFPFLNIVGAEGAIDGLTVNALGGNDVVDAGSLAANAIGLTLNGGAGNDELLAGGGNDLVNGGAGDDRVFLEAGDDTFVWNPGDGSDTVEGMTGRDTMVFNGNDLNENFTISANGPRGRVTRDVGNVAMDLGDVERVDVNPLGGADVIVTNELNGTNVTEINLNLSGAPAGNVGDAQADSVIVNGSNGPELIPVLGTAGGILVNGDFLGQNGLPYFMVIRAVDSADTLRINGNGANDRIEADLDTPVILIADGGAGQDTVDVASTASNGVVSVAPGSGSDTVNVNTDARGVANVSFDSTQRIGALSVGSGGVVTLTSGGTKVLTVASLSISGTGMLNLSDNNLIVDYTGASPVGSIQALLTSGFANGAWNGVGINSSSAASTPNRALGFAEATDLFGVFPATFAGQSVDASSVLIRFTVPGDANLDRAANIGDFAAVAANFNGAGTRWSRGNFNYNAATDLADFAALAANFNRSIAGDLPRAVFTNRQIADIEPEDVAGIFG